MPPVRRFLIVIVFVVVLVLELQVGAPRPRLAGGDARVRDRRPDLAPAGSDELDYN